MPIALFAGVGAFIIFLSLWPFLGVLTAFAIAPFGGSLLAVGVIVVMALWARAQRNINRLRDERDLSEDRHATSKSKLSR